MMTMSKRLAFLIPAVALLALPRAVGGEPTPSFIPGSGWIMEAGKAATGGTTGGLPGKAMGWINDAFGKGGKAGAEALAAYEPLTKGDKAADPNHQPSGSPKVPSHCTAPDGTKTEGCNDCYAAAYRKLTAVRTALEKLRRVGATTRAFSAKSIAFGDSVSGVHGVAGLGWQPERAKIEASLTQFEKAYDAKYVELMGLLEVALKDIGQCEAKHFNQADWYDRYGFIYYTFMADRYRGQ